MVGLETVVQILHRRSLQSALPGLTVCSRLPIMRSHRCCPNTPARKVPRSIKKIWNLAGFAQYRYYRDILGLGFLFDPVAPLAINPLGFYARRCQEDDHEV